MRARARGSARLAALAAFGLGGALTTLGALLTAPSGVPSGPPPAPGPVAVWAADRDGGRVFGLDADLFLAARVPVDWPLDVEPARDGGLWVLRAGSPGAGSPGAAATHRLDRFDAHGALVTELWIERALDLDVLAGGAQALLVEERTGSPPRLVRVAEEGSVVALVERDGLASCLGERAHALGGTRDGVLVRVDAANGALVAEARLGGSIADLAAGPEPGSVWALDAAGPVRLLLLAPDLTLRWQAVLPHAAAHVAPVAGEERVWIAALGEPCALRYGPGGALELERCGLPLGGFDRALALERGLLLAAGGAVLRIDARGALQPGQGGFALLTDLAPAAR